jgi:hypothetical protein
LGLENPRLPYNLEFVFVERFGSGNYVLQESLNIGQFGLTALISMRSIIISTGSGCPSGHRPDGTDQLSDPDIIQAFAEMFNATDNVNFNSPTGNMQSSSFQEATSAQDPRLLQLGFRVNF